MIWRWVVRGVFILPILLCVGGWGWSYAGGSPVVGYGREETKTAPGGKNATRRALYSLLP